MVREEQRDKADREAEIPLKCGSDRLTIAKGSAVGGQWSRRRGVVMT